MMSPRGPRLDRRAFFRRAFGGGRAVTLPCGRLYVRYVDAAASGRPADFVRAVDTEIGDATEIRLSEREWLARDDFRRTLEQILSSRPVKASGP